MLELLPISATSLLPVVLFPLLGIMTTAQVMRKLNSEVVIMFPSIQVSVYYLKSSCMLFLGGLMVAIAIEHSNLHR